MSNQTLFTPYTLGDLTLSNRVVLAPLTRNRAGAGFVPSEFAATYYSQRASAGLLISEATQISRQGQGYQDTPGIYTPAQIDGWRQVTDYGHLSYEQRGPVTVITINRPERMNAIGPQTHRELVDAWAALPKGSRAKARGGTRMLRNALAAGGHERALGLLDDAIV